MKAIIALCLAGVVFVQAASAQTGTTQGATAAPPSSTQTPEVQESNRLNAQVVKLHGEGKYDEALPLAERVLALREKALGAEHELVAVSLNNLATIRQVKGDRNAAEQLYERALTIYEKTKGAEDLKVSQVLDRLAVLQTEKRSFDKAASLYQRSLSIKEKNLGAEHLEVIRSLFDLARFYDLRDEAEKAEPLLRRIAEMETKSDGRVRSYAAEALMRLSCRIQRRSNTDEAAQLEARAREIIKSLARDGSGEIVAEDVINGKVISKPAPHYPAEAKRTRAQGEIKVRILVDESGRVVSACALNGAESLRQASEWAAYSARFTPTSVAGKPVKVAGFITYRFVLQ